MAKHTSLRNAVNKSQSHQLLCMYEGYSLFDDIFSWCPCQNTRKVPIYFCHYFSFKIVRRIRGSISIVTPRIFINTLKIEVKRVFSARIYFFFLMKLGNILKQQWAFTVSEARKKLNFFNVNYHCLQCKLEYKH